MLEYNNELSLAQVEDLAAQSREGDRFRVFTSAKPARWIPDGMGSFTYSGCTRFAGKRRRFCKRPVGPKRELFQDDRSRKCHSGPCSVEGLQFYRFILELNDGTRSIYALCGDPASYLFGGDKILPAHEFAALTKGNRTKLISTVTEQMLSFQLQYTVGGSGVGSWTIIRASYLPLHSFKTPSPSTSLSGRTSKDKGLDSTTKASSMLDGSPMTRLLNLQPRRNPRNGIPVQAWRHDDVKHLVLVLQILPCVSVALKQAAIMLDVAIDKLAAYIGEHDHT